MVQFTHAQSKNVEYIAWPISWKCNIINKKTQNLFPFLSLIFQIFLTEYQGARKPYPFVRLASPGRPPRLNRSRKQSPSTMSNSPRCGVITCRHRPNRRPLRHRKVLFLHRHARPHRRWALTMFLDPGQMKTRTNGWVIENFIDFYSLP